MFLSFASANGICTAEWRGACVHKRQSQVGAPANEPMKRDVERAQCTVCIPIGKQEEKSGRDERGRARERRGSWPAAERDGQTKGEPSAEAAAAAIGDLVRRGRW